jgi:colicin import membrane protein
MARPGITREQVTQAADALVAEGIHPSIEAIRKRLGTGSPNTVHKHLTEWRAARPQTPVASREIPASLTAALAAEIERATAHARAEIEGRLIEAQAEAAALADAGEALEVDREALTEQVSALATERDTLTGQAIRQTADLTALSQRIEREQQAAESARVELATARLKIEAQAERQAEQVQEIQRLRAALEAQTAARVAGEQSAAVLASQLDALRSQLAELREVRDRIEGERDQAREQAHRVEGESKEQARRIVEQGAIIDILRADLAKSAAACERLNPKAQETASTTTAAAPELILEPSPIIEQPVPQKKPATKRRTPPPAVI